MQQSSRIANDAYSLKNIQIYKLHALNQARTMTSPVPMSNPSPQT